MALVSAICLTSTNAPAAIVLDYSNDTFFGGATSIRTTARNALEAAVADINAVLDLNLGAITNDTATGSFAGPFGTSTASLDFSYSYTNPTTGAGQVINDTTLAANEIRIFVGMRPLSGTTLGQGGSGGIGVSAGTSAFPGEAQFAMDDAVANVQHRRGDGPTITTISGAVGGTTYSAAIGPTIGNLWFDNDVTGGAGIDSDADLDAFWHFDHTTDVEFSKFDFYSVALHEVLHSIGFGGSQTWNSLTSGTTWLGTEAINEFGTGMGLIDAGGAHIAMNTMSISLVDGSMQEVAMDPDITNGTRKHLTLLDVAFLRDLGYTTNVVAIPEPSSFLLVATAVGVVAMVRRRKPV